MDGRKSGGRKAGTINKRQRRLPDAQAIAERLGVNPLEVLLHFASNNWQALGYESDEKKRATPTGFVLVDRIETSERIAAAQAACVYLYPKLASIQHADPDGAVKTFADLMKELVTQSVEPRTD